MSDLSDLHGIYPNSLRWNAETGVLAISAFDPKSGERELKPIEFGQPATFALDMATRERGYGRIRVGEYDMRLTPVGSPAPPWPGDGEEYKPAIGVWGWSPQHGEVRIETNAALFRQAIDNVFREAKCEPEAAKGEQPVVCIVNRVLVTIKALKRDFFAPLIERASSSAIGCPAGRLGRRLSRRRPRRLSWPSRPLRRLPRRSRSSPVARRPSPPRSPTIRLLTTIFRRACNERRGHRAPTRCGAPGQ
jgi:hypothetical protein